MLRQRKRKRYDKTLGTSLKKITYNVPSLPGKKGQEKNIYCARDKENAGENISKQTIERINKDDFNARQPLFNYCLLLSEEKILAAAAD